MELTKVVPFLVENEMMRLGATFSKVRNRGVHVVTDGLLITGQNPASSGPTANAAGRISLKLFSIELIAEATRRAVASRRVRERDRPKRVD